MCLQVLLEPHLVVRLSLNQCLSKEFKSMGARAQKLQPIKPTSLFEKIWVDLRPTHTCYTLILQNWKLISTFAFHAF